jgi:hypothetical protein
MCFNAEVGVSGCHADDEDVRASGGVGITHGHCPARSCWKRDAMAAVQSSSIVATSASSSLALVPALAPLLPGKPNLCAASVKTAGHGLRGCS